MNTLNELVLKTGTWLIDNGPSFLTNLITFFIIIIFGKILISVACRVLSQALSRTANVNDILRSFVIDTLRKVLWVIVLMIGLPIFGIDMSALIAGLGVTGFILGFAFQESLGNLAAGLMLLLNQPFKVGDFIEAAGISGVVKELNLMATTLTSPDNKKIMVPNRNIWGGNITNYSALETRRVDMTVGISYSANIGQAIDVIRNIVTNHPLIHAEPAPVIEVVAMADSSVNLVVRPWCNTPDYWAVFFSLQRTIKETFDTEGIEIPFPQLDVHHHGLPKT